MQTRMPNYKLLVHLTFFVLLIYGNEDACSALGHGLFCDDLQSGLEVIGHLNDLHESSSSRQQNRLRLKGLSFDPPLIDFGAQSLFNPKLVEVVVSNVDPDHTIEILTYAAFPPFLLSKINPVVIAPLACSKFDVTFLPSSVGYFESTVHLNTSVGIGQYQIFGSGFISDDYLSLVVNFEYLKAMEQLFHLYIYNPFSYTVIVSQVAEDAHCQPDGVIVSAEDANSPGSLDNGTKFIEPWTMGYLSSKHICGSDKDLVKICTYIQKPSFDHSNFTTSTMKNTNVIPLLNDNSHYLQLTTLVAVLDRAPSEAPILRPHTSLIHFGLINQSTGVVSQPIYLIYSGGKALRITYIRANVFHPCFSIQKTTNILLPDHIAPQQVAVFNVSSSHITRTENITGSIIVRTIDVSLAVTIPFYFRVLFGAINTSSTQDVYVSQEGISILRFNYSITNFHDFDLTIFELHFPGPLIHFLQFHQLLHYSTIIKPNQTVQIASVSVVGELTRQTITDQMLVKSNINMFFIEFELYTGWIDLWIEKDAHLVDNIYTLKSLLVGENCTQFIVIYNHNPIEIYLAKILVTTDEPDQVASIWAHPTDSNHWTNSCVITGMNENCMIKTDHLKPYSYLKIPLTWGNSRNAQHVEGFVIVESDYQIIKRKFQFFVTHGLLTINPDPLLVQNLFPGKIVRRNVTVHSSYSTPISLQQIKLFCASSHWFNSVQFHPYSSIQRVSPNLFTEEDILPSAKLFNATTLQPGETLLLGHIEFDPLKNCVNHLTQPLSLPYEDDAHSFTQLFPNTFCYSGLDASHLWLDESFLLSSADRHSFGLSHLISSNFHKHNHNTNKDNFLFVLLQQSIKIYFALQTIWHRNNQFIRQSFPSNPSSYLSSSLRFELVDQQHTLFHSTIHHSLVWPSLLKTVESIINMNQTFKSTHQYGQRTRNQGYDKVHLCDIDQLPQNGKRETQILHVLRMSNVTFIREQLQCDFRLLNPSDKRLIIQPIIWNEVKHNLTISEYTRIKDLLSKVGFSNLTSDLSPTDDRHGSGSGEIAFIDLISSEFGDFSIKPIGPKFHRPADNDVPKHYQSSLSRYHLTVGLNNYQNFRLTFNPNLNRFANVSEKVKSIYSLLILRNNLTSLELIPIEIRFGQLSASLNRPTHCTTSSSSNSETNNHDQTISVSAVYSQSMSQTSNEDQDGDSKQHICSNSGESFYKLEWQFNYLQQLFMISQPSSAQAPKSIRFDMNERTVGLFCCDQDNFDNDLFRRVQAEFLAPGLMPNLATSTFASITDFRTQFLVNLSLRQHLLLINTGHIKMRLHTVALLPSLPSMKSSFFINNVTNRHHHFYQNSACLLSGFKVTPCILPYANKTASILELQPGGQFLFELRHFPDFMHTYKVVQLLVLLEPNAAYASNVWSDKMSNFSDQGIIEIPLIVVESHFVVPVLARCLKLLPRPAIEARLWFITLAFYLLNLFVVLLSSLLDATRVLSVHREARRLIDQLPMNSTPNVNKVFRSQSALKNDDETISLGLTSQSSMSSKSSVLSSLPSNLCPAVSTKPVNNLVQKSTTDKLVHHVPHGGHNQMKWKPFYSAIQMQHYLSCCVQIIHAIFFTMRHSYSLSYFAVNKSVSLVSKLIRSRVFHPIEAPIVNNLFHCKVNNSESSSVIPTTNASVKAFLSTISSTTPVQRSGELSTKLSSNSKTNALTDTNSIIKSVASNCTTNEDRNRKKKRNKFTKEHFPESVKMNSEKPVRPRHKRKHLPTPPIANEHTNSIGSLEEHVNRSSSPFQMAEADIVAAVKDSLRLREDGNLKPHHKRKMHAQLVTTSHLSTPNSSELDNPGFCCRDEEYASTAKESPIVSVFEIVGEDQMCMHWDAIQHKLPSVPSPSVNESLIDNGYFPYMVVEESSSPSVQVGRSCECQSYVKPCPSTSVNLESYPKVSLPSNFTEYFTMEATSQKSYMNRSIASDFVLPDYLPSHSWWWWWSTPLTSSYPNVDYDEHFLYPYESIFDDSIYPSQMSSFNQDELLHNQTLLEHHDEYYNLCTPSYNSHQNQFPSINDDLTIPSAYNSDSFTITLNSPQPTIIPDKFNRSEQYKFSVDNSNYLGELKQLVEERQLSELDHEMNACTGRTFRNELDFCTEFVELHALSKVNPEQYNYNLLNSDLAYKQWQSIEAISFGELLTNFGLSDETLTASEINRISYPPWNFDSAVTEPWSLFVEESKGLHSYT